MTTSTSSHAADVDALQVACAVEGTYDAHSAAMLHSVLQNSPERPVVVHYLHGPRLPPRSAEKLRGMVARLGGTIAFHEVPDSRVVDLPAPCLFTSAMWYRLLLPELLPDVERILYLDVDTLAVDALDSLWQTELGDHYLAAVTNVFLTPEHAQRVSDLGVQPESYFNSGVLLLNLEQLRVDNCLTAIRELVQRRQTDLVWPDQDALNLVLGGRRVALHPRWNCMNSVLYFPWAKDIFGEGTVESARRRPGIRHFEGPEGNKPWHVLNRDKDRRLYFRHRRQTPWPLVRRTGVTPGNLSRRVTRIVRRSRT